MTCQKAIFFQRKNACFPVKPYKFLVFGFWGRRRLDLDASFVPLKPLKSPCEEEVMSGNSVSHSVFSANLYDDKGGWGLPHFLLEFSRRVVCGLTPSNSPAPHLHIHKQRTNQKKGKTKFSCDPFPVCENSSCCFSGRVLIFPYLILKHGGSFSLELVQTPHRRS